MFKCNSAHSDMFIKKHQKEAYKAQYELLKELQKIATEIKMKIDLLNI